ncbi:MAG: hypothetical protein KKA07_12800 [Bacteroidetes bacterium]|nr:hypothetical protein [Bacteroidota bacterium]MBU1719937.1 hypothetical protein [Bacteroidota bacterium]
MKLIRKILCLVGLITILSPVSAQEMLGIVNGNYSGSSGVMINPAGFVEQKVYKDFCIAALDVFYQNNYTIVTSGRGNFFYEFRENAMFDNHEIHAVTDQFTKGDNQAFFSYRINGPSAMYAFSKHAVAVHYASRSCQSILNMPYYVSADYYDTDYNLALGTDYRTSGYSVNSLQWREIGVSYSGHIIDKNKDLLLGGLTINKLNGVAGNNISVTTANLSMNADTTLVINKFTGSQMYTADGKSGSGSGWGFDMGLVYHRKINQYRSNSGKACKRDFNMYRYRIGFSILDLGTLNFKNAQTRSFAIDSLPLLGADSINYFGKVMMVPASNNSGETKIGLPSALSFQFDFFLGNNFFINSTFVNPMNSKDNMIRRTFLFSITPRYETKGIEVNLPLTLCDNSYKRIGLSLRIYWFTIGTEHIFGMADIETSTNYDFYASIKINFVRGKCIGSNGIKNLFRGGLFGNGAAKSNVEKCRTFK